MKTSKGTNIEMEENVSGEYCVSMEAKRLNQVIQKPNIDRVNPFDDISTYSDPCRSDRSKRDPADQSEAPKTTRPGSDTADNSNKRAGISDSLTHSCPTL